MGDWFQRHWGWFDPAAMWCENCRRYHRKTDWELLTDAIKWLGEVLPKAFEAMGQAMKEMARQFAVLAQGDPPSTP